VSCHIITSVHTFPPSHLTANAIYQYTKYTKYTKHIKCTKYPNLPNLQISKYPNIKIYQICKYPNIQISKKCTNVQIISNIGLYQIIPNIRWWGGVGRDAARVNIEHFVQTQIELTFDRMQRSHEVVVFRIG
jgi:hypothetical protein